MRGADPGGCAPDTRVTMDVPRWSTLHGLATVLAIAAILAMLRFKVGMGWTLLGSAAIGALAFAKTGQLPR